MGAGGGGGAGIRLLKALEFIEAEVKAVQVCGSGFAHLLHLHPRWLLLPHTWMHLS